MKVSKEEKRGKSSFTVCKESHWSGSFAENANREQHF